jgi:carbon storage regulator CsrA
VVVVTNQIKVIVFPNGSPIERGDGSRRSALVPVESSSEAQAEPPTTKEPGTMLVVGRKVHEKIAISDNIHITVVSIHGNRVQLGVEAPRNVKIIRQDLSGPGDAGREAGEPPIPRSPDGRGTDGEPLRGRSRRAPRRG